MSILLFSNISDGETVAFDPASDVLSIDDAGLSASALQLSYAGDFSQVVFTIGSKSFHLPSALTILQIDSSNVQFADGSLFSPGTGADDTYSGGSGGDFLSGMSGTDTLDGGGGNDHLSGGDGADIVRGADGNDYLDGGAGADAMYGGLGDDTYVVDNSGDVVSEAPSTEAAIVQAIGITGSGWLPFTQISADGRYVVLHTDLTLVGGDSNYDNDIFVKDTLTGTLTRASLTDDGFDTAYGSRYGQISADGRYVAYNGGDSFYVRDLVAGTTTLISTDPQGVEDNRNIVAISTDGRYVVFENSAGDLVSGDNNSTLDVFRKDMQTGDIELVSCTASGEVGNSSSFDVRMSSDGRYVAFKSYASDLVDGDGNNSGDIFFKDMDTGEIKLVSEASDGWQAGSFSSVEIADMSGDGRYVVFRTDSSGFVPGIFDLNHGTDILVKDMLTGEVKYASVNEFDNIGNSSSDGGRISDDGRYVVFSSTSSDLVAEDGSPNYKDVFIKDMQTGELRRVSVSENGQEGSGASFEADISGDGRWISYVTDAANLRGGLNDGTRYILKIENPFLSGGTDSVNAGISYTLGSDIENLTLTGSANINGTGNGLDNIITGNSGNNVLNGGTGADTLIGLTGNDTYAVDSTNDIVTESASAGIDLVQSSVTWTLGSNIENLTLTGSGAINGTGNALDNVITGNSGKNILKGGAGNDTYVVGSGDAVTESVNAGIDLVQSSVAWTLGGNIENLTLTGSGAINGTGNTLDNVITGNSGKNILSGGTGNDTYVVGSGDAAMESANAGTDRVLSSVTWTLGNNIEQLTLTGSNAINGTGNALANSLAGNGGNNVINGADGNDILSGGGGNDTLIGGTGKDSLTGGTGKDFFRFDKALNANTNLDTIKDFKAVDDTVQLENSIFKKLTSTGTLKAANFKASTSGKAGDANDFILYETDTGKLFYDADGSGKGAAIQFALVGGHPTMTAADFTVI